MAQTLTERLENCLPEERMVYDYVGEAPAATTLTVLKISQALDLQYATADEIVASLIARKLLKREGSSIDIYTIA